MCRVALAITGPGRKALKNRGFVHMSHVAGLIVDL